MEPRLTKLQNSEVRIEPTNLCNYDCIMCPRSTHTRTKGIMDMGLYKDIIDQVVVLGAEKITLTNFGEPFIDPTLEEKIKLATSYNLDTYVISNMSLVHKPSNLDKTKTKLEMAMKSGLKELRISFYGKNKTDYSNIMKGGNFDAVVDNFKLLSELKQKYDNISVSHYILDFDDSGDPSNNYPNELAEVIDYYEVWKPHNFGDGRKYREMNSAKSTCGRPQNGPLQINWSGVVVPCCYDYNENINLGNVKDDKIINILNGDRYNGLRSAHNNNNYTNYKYCDNCDQLLCNKHQTSIVKSTNPVHNGMDNKDIVSRTNTSPEYSLI